MAGQRVASFQLAPLSETIAVTWSACSQAIRNAMNPPFEWPIR